MINFKLIFISLFLCTLAFSDDYIKIELSDSKNKLSKEVFQKLQKNHYLKKISDKDLYAYNVYQIEGEGRALVSNIDGDEDTIMGLPIKKIKEYLELQK